MTQSERIEEITKNWKTAKITIMLEDGATVVTESSIHNLPGYIIGLKEGYPRADFLISHEMRMLDGWKELEPFNMFWL